MIQLLFKLKLQRLVIMLLCFILVMSGMILTAKAETVSGNDITYTMNADFDKGMIVNLNHEVQADQLQLNTITKPFPYINIAASSRGTIVRVDVNTGQVLGEYYTAPSGRSRNPSRTTVDLYGNVWVSNRNESSGGKGSVTRVGLIIGGTRVNQDGTPNSTGQYLAPPFQYTTCIDKNNDGLIKTSRGLGNILAWSNAGGADTNGGVFTADDECIINYTRTIATNARTIAIDSNNDVWVGGANMAHSKLDGKTGQPVPGTSFNLNCGGYGGLIDKNGVLWSARYGNGLLRFDTKTMTGRCLGNGMGDYGLGIDPVTGNIWHSSYGSGKVGKISPDGALLGRYNQGYSYTKGVTVDAAGNVWVAHSGSSTVGHLKTDGTYVGKVSVGYGPTGVAVDANGKVWATNYNSSTASRIDPNGGPIGGGGRNVGAVDLTVSLGSGAGPYNYSDMTGYVSLGVTSPQGYWKVTQDSGKAGNNWGKINWNSEFSGTQPDGTEIIVEARAADIETNLNNKQYLLIANGAPFLLIGRYIDVRVTLKSNSSGESPVFTDMKIISLLSNVQVIDTINTQNNTLIVNSITPAPDSITTQGDNTYIAWHYDDFSPNRLENLMFNVTLKDPVSGEKRIVNHKLEVLYADVNGNPVKMELGPLYVNVMASAFDSSIATDKINYQANENVLINASIAIKSDYARTIDAKILIEDNQGNLVTQAANMAGLSFAAGETKTFNNIILDTGSTYAGGYRAHLILYDNSVKVGEALSNFTIQQPAGSASVSASISTDKMSYNANETVTINSAVQNTAANVILNNLTARVTLSNSGGTVLYAEDQSISTMASGQLAQLKNYWSTGTNSPGSYSVKLEVLDGVNLLCTATASFTIAGTGGTNVPVTSLKGTLSVSPNSVYVGSDVSVGYTVTNNGNEDISLLKIKILIVDPVTQTVKTEITDQQAVAKGSSVIGVGLNNVSTSTFAPGTYIAILQVATEAMTEFKTLAKANFEVQAGLEVSKKIPDITKLLIWINANCNQVKNDEGIVVSCCAPNDSTCTRIDLLERMLKNASIKYLIVYSKDDFQRHMRNSYFTDYLILGSHQPLEDHHAYELRELIHSGKGLISSLFVDEGSPNTPLAGLKVSGYLPSVSRNINLSDSAIAASTSFASEGKAAKTEALAGATVAGWISDVNLPAVVLNDYGWGRSIYYAFDMGATLNEQNYEKLASLIVNSIVYVHKPLMEKSFLPNQFVPVEVHIKSLGGIFDLKIKETYPAQIKIYDPISGLWVTDNPWLQDMHIESNQTKYFRYYVLTPDVAGEYTLNTEIGYMKNDVFQLYKEVDTTIAVENDSTVYTESVISALNALAVSNKENAHVSNAIKYMEQIKDREGNNTKSAFENNIQDILKAVEAIMKVTSCDTTQVRLVMDMLLQIYQGKYFFGQENL